METRETFAGLSTWQIALWYALIVISTSIFAWGVGRLVIKYRARAGQLPGRQAAAPRRPDRLDRAHPRLDQAPGRRRRACTRDDLLRLRRALHRHGDPRVPGRLRQADPRVGLLAGDVLSRLLVVPRRLRRPPHRRPRDPGCEARPQAEASRLHPRRRRHEPLCALALRGRRLGLRRLPAVPGSDRVLPRGAADRRDRSVVREVVACRVARRPGADRNRGRRRDRLGGSLP